MNIDEKEIKKINAEAGKFLASLESFVNHLAKHAIQRRREAARRGQPVKTSADKLLRHQRR